MAGQEIGSIRSTETVGRVGRIFHGPKYVSMLISSNLCFKCIRSQIIPVFKLLIQKLNYFIQNH